MLTVNTLKMFFSLYCTTRFCFDEPGSGCRSGLVLDMFVRSTRFWEMGQGGPGSGYEAWIRISLDLNIGLGKQSGLDQDIVINLVLGLEPNPNPVLNRDLDLGV